MASAAAAVFCTGGENTCPPEDVGGAPGYANFLAAISDPLHVRRHFDPARFDQAAVNGVLARVGV